MSTGKAAQGNVSSRRNSNDFDSFWIPVALLAAGPRFNLSMNSVGEEKEQGS